MTVTFKQALAAQSPAILLDDLAPPFPPAIKTGQIIAEPAGLSTPFGIVCCGVVDLHAITGNTTSPYRLMMAVTTDHDSGSDEGLRAYFANNYEGPWSDFDDVRDKFVTAGYTGLPTANPIYQHPTTGDKGEFGVFTHDGRGKLLWIPHSGNGFGDGLADAWVATADATNPFAWTYHDRIGNPYVENHGGYNSLVNDGGLITLRGGTNQLYPIRYAPWYSRDGVNYGMDHRLLHTRDSAWYGLPDRQVGKNWQVLKWQGADWAITFERPHPVSGGTNGAGRIVACRISDDHRRIVGPPVTLIDVGGSGDFDENDVGTGIIRLAYDPINEPTTLHIYYQGRDSSNRGTIGHAAVDLESTALAPRTWAIAAGYEPIANAIDAQGLLTPAGPTPAATVIDTRFGLGTSLPAEWQAVSGDTGTITVSDMATGNGGARLAATTNNETARLVTAQAFNTANLREIWLTIEGFTASDLNSHFQFGFTQLPTDSAVIMWEDWPGNRQRFGWRDGSGNYQFQEVPNHTFVAENHIANKNYGSIGLVKRYTQATDSTEVYAVLMQADQVVACHRITGQFGDGPVHAIVRLIGRGTAATVDVTRCVVRVGEEF